MERQSQQGSGHPGLPVGAQNGSAGQVCPPRSSCPGEPPEGLLKEINHVFLSFPSEQGRMAVSWLVDEASRVNLSRIWDGGQRGVGGGRRGGASARGGSLVCLAFLWLSELVRPELLSRPRTPALSPCCHDGTLALSRCCREGYRSCSLLVLSCCCPGLGR